MDNIIVLEDSDDEKEKLANILETNISRNYTPSRTNFTPTSTSSSNVIFEVDLTSSPPSSPSITKPMVVSSFGNRDINNSFDSSTSTHSNGTINNSARNNSSRRNSSNGINPSNNNSIINNTIIFVNNSSNNININNLNINRNNPTPTTTSTTTTSTRTSNNINNNTNSFNNDRVDNEIKRQKTTNNNVESILEKEEEEGEEVEEDTSTIKPQPNVDNKKTHFQCKICNENMMLNSITSTMCGHCFDKKCIETYLKKSSTCPTCKKKISIKQLHPLYLNLEKF